MGLRPSVKQDEPIKSSSAINKPLHQPNQNHCNCEEPSSSADPRQPQREAWTARGQLLLNFHHAISRAINSPEMIRKCNEIAQDMHRTEAEQQQLQQHQQQSSHPSRSQPRSLSKDYTAEAQLIIENKSKRDTNVRNKSLACGLVSFVLLRGTRGLSALLRRSIANSRGTSLATTGNGGALSLKSYKFDKPAHLLKNTTANTTANSTSSTTTASASSSSTKEPAVSTLRTLFRLTLDLTISTTITFLSATFLFLPKPSAYIEDMSKLPLCEGKSVYAEMVCPPLLKEYKRVMEEYGGRWPVATTVVDGSSSSSGSTSGNATLGSTSIASNNETSTKKNGRIENNIGMTQEDVSLNIIRKFVENCSKRSIYEQALREERSVLLSNSDSSLSPSSSSGSKSLEDASTVSRLIRRLTASSSTTSSGSSSDALSSASNKNNNNKLGTISIPNPGVPENISVDLDVDVFSLAPAAASTSTSSSSNHGDDGS